MVGRWQIKLLLGELLYRTFHSIIRLIVVIPIDDVTRICENDDAAFFLSPSLLIRFCRVALLNDVQIFARSQNLVSVTVQKCRNLKSHLKLNYI